jgi:hypothetical protein
MNGTSDGQYDFPELSAVYLEDSYVLRTNEGDGTTSFSMLLALTDTRATTTPCPTPFSTACQPLWMCW